MRKRIASLLVVAIISIGVFGAVSASAGTFGCGHGSQSIHEITAPASWPGTRAAHTVWIDPAGNRNQNVYTKSGWWDPTWDFYFTSFKLC